MEYRGGCQQPKGLQMFPYDEDPFPDYVPTSDEVTALALYAERHGDNWKEDLALAWFHGRDANALPDPHGPALRRVRNRGGERWLALYMG